MKKNIVCIIAVAAVMLLIPALAVTFIRGSAGMLVSLCLFFLLDPVCAILSGGFAGSDLRRYWYIPLITAILFLAGAWLCFSLWEVTFVFYALGYLVLCAAAMLLVAFIRSRAPARTAQVPAGFTCRIANQAEMAERWDALIAQHPDDRENWSTWRAGAMRSAALGDCLPYYGFLDGKPVCEATAVLKPELAGDPHDFMDGQTAYLSAFRTDEACRGKGYFSRLFGFMMDDLVRRGVYRAVVGVEPQETRNREIYTHYGFTEYVGSGTETYPDGTVITYDNYAKRLVPDYLKKHNI